MVVWEGSKHERGWHSGTEPQFPKEGDCEKWRRLAGAGRGHLGPFTPCSALDTLTPVSACAGAYVHSCHSSIRDLQSAVRCRGCIYRGGLLLLLLLLFALLSSFVGCLIARVNKFTKLRFSSLFFFFSLGNLPLHFANNF